MKKKLSFGWIPDYPDIRDYTETHEEIKPLLKKAKLDNLTKTKIPTKVDLRKWCSPIEDQEDIGSCTAQAGASLMEYFERRAHGNHIDASRLFLYKVTRKLLHWTGDTGAYLRTTMGAMALFGAPPEEYWPYDTSVYDVEPPPFCYAFAQNYQALKYMRLDPPFTKPDVLLNKIKANLTAGIPSMFGFAVYESIWQADNTGKIPYPELNEKQLGGHAIAAVGYDDNIEITNNLSSANKTKGAFLIRNSWGESWGDNGYGWLPYKYVLAGLADDWWTLLKQEWIDTGNFTL